MKTFRQFASLALLLAISLGTLAAFEWPVPEPHPVRFFGQRAFGVTERGVVLEKADSIRASGHGTLLIAMTQNRDMSGFPSTLGNAAVLSHDEGLMTIYGNLDSVDRIAERKTVETGDILANAGTSAWGRPGMAIFQVVDREKRTVLNPLLLLPTLSDKKAPVIRNVVVVTASNQTWPLGSIKTLRQGKYKLFAEVPDNIDGSSAELAPFRITIQVNGKEYSSIPFEILQEKTGELYLSDPDFTWKKLYVDQERMYLGELSLTRGRADISIIAKDAVGNERSVLFGLQIE
jgi:hypothetical protein